MAKSKASKKSAAAKKKASIFEEMMLEKVDDDDDEAMDPESAWDARTKALKASIEGGLEKALELAKDEGSSFEEDTLASSGDEEEDSEEEENEDESVQQATQKGKNKVDRVAQADDNDDDASKSSDESEEEKEAAAKPKVEEASDVEEAESEEEETKKIEEVKPTVQQKNTLSSKALGIVTKDLVARKSGWDWAETFDIVPYKPLPFDKETSVHDDLKREVAFYDLALEAVQEAKKNCETAGIPFSRPDDFFAEMVKTDAHMAKVKDRLIFDNKRIEAVSQRKSNKEHMLRAKESKANKLAEKSKRKKDHFQAVEDWASSAAAGRGQRLTDNDDVDAAFGKHNRRRENADKKYGHGGKTGRFKQNDPRSKNDFSDYYKSRNSGDQGGRKRKNGSGAERKGKRARDAARSSR